jgi:hypothetical protein
MFLVGKAGDGVVILKPLPKLLVTDEVINLAAYLLMMAGDDINVTMEEVGEIIENS